VNEGNFPSLCRILKGAVKRHGVIVQDANMSYRVSVVCSITLHMKHMRCRHGAEF